jgi:hypothetical protein
MKGKKEMIMNNLSWASIRRSLPVFVFAMAVSLSFSSGAEALGEPGRPTLGVYRDCGRKGTSGTDEFSAWLGLPVTLGQDSMPTVATWEHLRGEPWLLDPWAEWKKKGPRRRFVLSVAMLPGPRGLKGPSRGTAAGIPVSFEAGARGEYNAYFTALAENLIKAGLEDSILRIGWEMNGNWYTWSARGHEEGYAAYWRQIVTTIRRVPGAEKLQFNFNPTDDPGKCDIEKAWPGDDFVDVVGLDLYDCSWIPETYPFPEGLSEEEVLLRQKKVWAELHLPRLKRWSRFAQAHQKPFCFPEWGLCARPVKGGHGGGDNPYFIEKMHEFMTDPKNNVVAQSYFDCSVPKDVNTDHRLCPDEKGFSQFPRSAEVFKKLFGKP